MSMNPPAVEGNSVEFAYGDRVAIGASTFSIPFGAIAALVGPNGSGKSTLLNGIAGLIEPTAGALHVAVPPERVSYVLQGTKVNEALPITVREVVTMARYATRGLISRLREEDRQAVDAALERMDITAMAGRHLSELSGGQRQRVFIAQGLAQDHDILLLDEPVTGLDLVSAQAIDDIVHEEHERGRTVIMTTHDLDEARVADYVILLSGRVVAAGAPESVLTQEHLMDAYGSKLLHVEGERLFWDDPHHHPTSEAPMERTIHIESARTDLHPPH